MKSPELRSLKRAQEPPRPHFLCRSLRHGLLGPEASISRLTSLSATNLPLLFALKRDIFRTYFSFLRVKVLYMPRRKLMRKQMPAMKVKARRVRHRLHRKPCQAAPQKVRCQVPLQPRLNYYALALVPVHFLSAKKPMGK